MHKVVAAEQLRRYQDDGILFPLKILSTSEVSRFRSAFDELEARNEGKLDYAPFLNLHFRWASELTMHPALLDAVEEIIGPDILIQATLVLSKGPHDPAFVSWHQDGTYTNQQETPATSAWIALSDSTPETGCMRVIPGSHRLGMLPHAETFGEHNLLSHGQEVELKIDEASARDVVLRAGEMSLHQNKLIHGSKPNRSDLKRIGFITRFVTSQYKSTANPVVRARGEGDCRHLNVWTKPPADNLDEGIAAWKEFIRQRNQTKKS
jgi:non-heme Fe2+,alpha-ketoglutarate-dependent halogenase